MPKCPECSKEITHLFLYQIVNEVCWFKVDKDGDAEMEVIETNPIDDSSESYDCPECEQTIFYNWEEAEKFLQGKEV